jgi:hypothetical protein
LAVSSSIARIIDQARIQAPGALDGVLLMELFATMKAFFEQTDAWKQKVTINAQPYEPYYEIPSFDQAFINRLIWLKGSPPSGSDPDLALCDDLRPQRSGWLERAGETAILRIERPPSVAESWLVCLGLTVIDPTDNEGVPRAPDWLVEKYFDYIASGLLSRVAAQPGKPYTNPQIAMLHGRKFATGVSLARREARDGYLFGGQRWGFPQTFRTRSQRTW